MKKWQILNKTMGKIKVNENGVLSFVIKLKKEILRRNGFKHTT